MRVIAVAVSGRRKADWELLGLCPVAIEGALVFPGHPDDTSQFIGQSDGGLVVPASRLDVECPTSQPIRWAATSQCELCSIEHGAGTVDQKGSQIRVAALVDATEVAGAAAGVFSGRESDPGGQMPACAKPVDIDNGGPHRRRSKWSDTRDLQQLSDDLVFSRESGELSLCRQDAAIQVADLAHHIHQDGSQHYGHKVVFEIQLLSDTGQPTSGAHGNRDTEFTQATAQPIDTGRARSHPLGTGSDG